MPSHTFTTGECSWSEGQGRRDMRNSVLLELRDVDFLITCSCSFWSQNSVGTRATSKAQGSTATMDQPRGILVANPAAQRGQLPRSNVHLAQSSNYCTGTSVTAAIICHRSMIPKFPEYISDSPSPSLHILLPLNGAEQRGAVTGPH